MKRIALLTMVALTAAAQQPAGKLDEAVRADVARLLREHRLEARPQPPNEWRRGRITYSGIAVQAARTRQPLQLINPLAPAGYGDGQQNVVADPATGRAAGWKLLALSF